MRLHIVLEDAMVPAGSGTSGAPTLAEPAEWLACCSTPLF